MVATLCESELLAFAQELTVQFSIILVVLLILSYFFWAKRGNTFLGVILAAAAFIVLIYLILLVLHPSVATMLHPISVEGAYHISKSC